MTRNRVVGAAALAAALLGTAACAQAAPAGTAAPQPVVTEPSGPTPALPAIGADGTCSGFSLSLYSDRGGRPTPTEAASWFAGHGGVGGIPVDGWHEGASDETGVAVTSGRVRLHTVRGPDSTWLVDSGSTC